MNIFEVFYRKVLYDAIRNPFSKVRVWAIRKLGFNIGEDVYVGPHLTLTIGLRDKSIKLVLGDRVSIGPNVSLILATRPNRSKLSQYINFPIRKIIIGEDTWLGANCLIMPGITIGKCCIVGAGAVVTHDVPDYTIVAGVPAKSIGKVDMEKLEKIHKL